MPRPLDLVLINYRSGERLLRLLRHHKVELASDFHVVLVDNDPGDPDRPRLMTEDLPGTFIENEVNQGFARAANQGARAGSSPWILFLNPDVSVPPGTFRLLSALPEPDPRVGALGAFCRHQPRGRWSSDPCPPRDPVRPYTVTWTAGSFLLVRRSAFQTAGGFDERFFMYFEDVDLCLRLRQAGYEIQVDPRIVYDHSGHGSYEASGRDQALDYRRGRHLFLDIHGPWLESKLYGAYRWILGDLAREEAVRERS